MKKGIHPNYYPNAKVFCACGAIFEVGATQKEIRTEICYRCHPFFTGKEKIVDKTGQVEKFKKRLVKTKRIKADNKEK